MKTQHVLIVDDVPQVRRELRTLLPLLDAIEIVGEAENGQAAIELAAALQPDVVLMDVVMPMMDGLAATRLIKQQCPQCRVIILSIHEDEAVRAQARSAGADDFVDKGAPLVALLRAIQAANVTTHPSCPAKRVSIGLPGSLTGDASRDSGFPPCRTQAPPEPGGTQERSARE